MAQKRRISTSRDPTLDLDDSIHQKTAVVRNGIWIREHHPEGYGLPTKSTVVTVLQLQTRHIRRTFVAGADTADMVCAEEFTLVGSIGED